MTTREEALDNIEVIQGPTQCHGMHKSRAVGRGGAFGKYRSTINVNMGMSIL